MTGKPPASAIKPTVLPSNTGDRKKRLAEQLRKNLRERKTQARARLNKDKSGV